MLKERKNEQTRQARPRQIFKPPAPALSGAADGSEQLLSAKTR